MLLFSSALSKHKLTFIKLSDCMKHLSLVAQWAEGEWGYIRNKGVEFRKEVLSNMSEHIYIGTLNNKPVAMFALDSFEFHSDLKKVTEKLPNVCELKYVYVNKEYRGLGFGRQVIVEAKRLAKKNGADLILLDTLKPSLNSIYQKQGAELICQNHLFSHPTDVLTITLG